MHHERMMIRSGATFHLAKFSDHVLVWSSVCRAATLPSVLLAFRILLDPRTLRRLGSETGLCGG